MGLGALIGAYQEDDSGGLRALLPLAGRTLLEYQVRCAAAAGAAPIVVLVDRIPPALNEALERLEGERLPVTAVTDANEAASRFGAGDLVLLLADGVAAPPELVAAAAAEEEPTVLTLPDDPDHAEFERLDAASRWSGIAVVDAQAIGATAAMLGDWDLQSTLLRRTLQSGARLLAIAPGAAEPVLAFSADDIHALDRQLIVSSRRGRRDWASRFVLPLVEDFATESLLATRIAPERLIAAAVLVTIGAAAAFLLGWRWVGLAMLVVSTPLDLIARRLAALRLRPLSVRSHARRLLWPAAGLAMLALGWWIWRDDGQWGALLAAAVAAAFAEAFRVERGRTELPGQLWLFSRRNAILGFVPFAAFGLWTLGLVALAIYAAVSFFIAQFAQHRLGAELTAR
ncbi:hypothetical protein G7078_05060 [Sphingomonas sinipercae]|uniref:Uncharacterized protein n=1 Tax=Sphingomonas sinipercae TaxID=2714944 RepID=A0A6G7ZMJ7_9SPHN|nr:hypothetical protein [Sphingomonas sinipercae]QIL02217.1 hypothetical protein G7078_05060 [Sphingomonas sinipercae]